MFRHGLRELGYVEGQSVAIEWRSADGKADRLPGLAAELVRLKVDVIVTGGSGVTAPPKETTLHPELSVKRLEVLKEMRPKLSRVATSGLRVGLATLGG